MRLFFAIPITDAIKEWVNSVRPQLEGVPDLLWTPESHFHITTLFLGEVAEEKKPMLLERARSLFPSMRPFKLTVTGLGPSPGRNRAPMIWIYFQNSNPFADLGFDLREDFREFVQREETRDPLPHITLARPMSRDLDRSKIPHIKTASPLTLEVTALELWQTQFGENGAEYEMLERFV